MTGLIRSSAKFLTGAGRAVSKGGKKIAGATIPKEIEFGIADKLDRGAKSAEKKARQIRFGPKAPPEQAVVPLPDEELLKREARRRRARRVGSRASTVLTGGDGEFVG